MKLFKPKKIKNKKLFKLKIKNLKQIKIEKTSILSYGKFGLKSLEKGELKPNQIESVRKILSKNIKKTGKFWINIFPNYFRTSKPSEVRMGKGKGNLNYWFCLIKSGQILFEVSTLNLTFCNTLMLKISKKLPFLTKIIKK